MKIFKKQFNDVALIVSSCDNYNTLLKYFFLQLKQNFSSFDGNIYTTASGNYNYEGYHIIGINKKYSNLSFSSRLIILLKNIKSRYILFFLDDFLLCSPINQSTINNGINVLKRDKKVGMIILHDSFPSNYVCNKKYNNYFDIRKKISPYKCTTQVSLWNRDFFKKNLRKGESAWDFELIGTYRLNHSRKKILYRNDKYNDCINYPKGGIVWNGIVNYKYQQFFNFSFNDIIIKNNNIKTNIKKPRLLNRINVTLAFIYPFLSIFITHSYRIGFNYIPKYIFKANDLSFIKHNKKVE